MGGIVSSGKSNEDLINNLVQVEYIKTSAAEVAFRAVDRAEYFLPENRGSAYQDAAWKCGHLHISAPCIYSEVIEGLCLEPGLSFLNLGSGTGYLSTVVGIILGSRGINHGIEYHEDVVEYAYKKLDEFKRYSGAMDEFEFCEPVFARANCLCLTEIRLYDRVYCGAACPVEYGQYLKNLIKIGGILVVPIGENLMQYKRTSETQWESRPLLPVAFANLLRENEQTQDLVKLRTPCLDLMIVKLLSCDFRNNSIRLTDIGCIVEHSLKSAYLLEKCVEGMKHNEIWKLVEVQPQSLQALSRNVIRTILRNNISKELPKVTRRPSVKEPTFRENLKNRSLIQRYIVPVLDESTDDEDDQHGNGWWELTRNNDIFGHILDVMKYKDMDESEEDTGTRRRNDSTQTEAGSSAQQDNERRASCSRNLDRHQSSFMEEGSSDGGVVIDSEKEDELNENPNATTSASMVANDGSVCSSISYQENKRSSNLSSSGWVESSESEATSSNQSRSTCDRKKMDSGIGDENEILEASDSEMNDNEQGDYMNELNDLFSRPNQSISDDEQSRNAKRSSTQEGSRSVKWRRVVSEPNMSTDSESEGEDSRNERRMYRSRYSIPMKKKIQELPLPQVLKNYVNYNRDF